MTNFKKILKYQSSWKSIQWQVSCSVQMDIQTDMTKLIRIFHNFTKRAYRQEPPDFGQVIHPVKEKGHTFSQILLISGGGSWSSSFTTMRIFINKKKHHKISAFECGFSLNSITLNTFQGVPAEFFILNFKRVKAINNANWQHFTHTLSLSLSLHAHTNAHATHNPLTLPVNVTCSWQCYYCDYVILIKYSITANIIKFLIYLITD